MNVSLENDKLLQDLESTKKELKVAHNGYQFAKSNEEIDYYIYQIKASQSKFAHLLNQIKELEKLANA